MQCSLCDNEIAKPVAFYKHMLVHMREKPFLYILCGNSAYRQIGMHLCVKLVMDIVNIVYYNFMRFGYIYVKVFNYLGLFLMSLIHKDFTSHTKVYPIVRYRSKITFIFYLVTIKVLRSVIYHNRYQSSRIDLLPLVCHTPERLPLILTKNVR